MNKIKLAGFTLVEMIVVMVISLFLIGVIYICTTFYFSFYETYHKQVNTSASCYTAYCDLFTRTELSRVLLWEAQDSSLAFLTLEEDTIRFRFSRSFILRSNGEGYDTLHLGCESLQCYFNEAPALNGIIDQAEISVSFRGNSHHFSFRKHYTPFDIFHFSRTYPDLAK